MSVVERLPLQITSIVTWADKLAVGTKKGVVIAYSVTAGATPDDVSIDFVESHKSFAKKPITQMYAAESHDIMISTCDNYVAVHRLSKLSVRLQTLDNSKGVDLFAVEKRGPSLALAVACKKTVMVYVHDGDKFSWSEKMHWPLPEAPRRGLAWAGDSLALAFDTQYALLDIANGKLRRVWQSEIDKRTTPSITLLPELERMLWSKENSSYFIDAFGKPAEAYALTWSDRPLQLRYRYPYVLAVVSNGVEVASLFGSHKVVQTLPLRTARFITDTGRFVFVAGGHHIWRLSMVPLADQMEELIRLYAYDEARALCDAIQWPADKLHKKEEKLRAILMLQGCHLLVSGDPWKAMTIFEHMKISPLWVIGLIPRLLPHKLQPLFRYPSRTPQLDANTFRPAVQALAEYLRQARSRLHEYDPPPIAGAKEPEDGAASAAALSSASASQLASPMAATDTNLSPKRQPWHDCTDVSVVVDTVLLKALVHTDPDKLTHLLDGSLTPPVPNATATNQCHIAESTKALVNKEQDKYLELVLLYKSNDMHMEALVLLSRLGQDQRPSPLQGPLPTINYLRKLGREHLEFIFRYSRWVLEQSPKSGMHIFTEPRTPEHSLPPHEVLQHLRSVHAALTVPYLEFLVEHEKVKDPLFHDQLSAAYLDLVLQLMTAQSAEEREELAKTRRKLARFLEASPHYYNPQRMLSRLPADQLLEERALLLSKIGQHRDALEIYVHRLHNTQLPLKYCERVFVANETENAESVYYSLLHVYLRPQSGEPLLAQALGLLREHYRRIDLPKALALLPDTSVRSVEHYLRSVLRENARRRRNNQVVRYLVKSENLQVHHDLLRARSQMVRITEDKPCPVCNKRLGKSVFARYPNGVVVHYHCARDKRVCPITGQQFSREEDAGTS